MLAVIRHFFTTILKPTSTSCRRRIQVGSVFAYQTPGEYGQIFHRRLLLSRFVGKTLRVNKKLA